MLSRHRLLQLALGGCLIAASATVSVPLYAQQNPAKKAEAAQAQQSQKPAELPLSVTISGPVHIEGEKQAESNWGNPQCANPGNHDEADLCQQRRMAEAAEQTVVLNEIQIVLGVLGFAALIVTIGYSRSATKAAIIAARAAQASADAIPNIERAYVFFWDVERDDRTLNLGGRITMLPTNGRTIVYKNCGKTPAIITKTRLDCDVFAQPPIPQTAPEKGLPSGAVIGAGDPWPRGKISITPEKIERAKAEKTTLYLYGEITYRDIFKKEQRSWFCRRWNGQQFVLADLADEKLNGST